MWDVDEIKQRKKTWKCWESTKPLKDENERLRARISQLEDTARFTAHLANAIEKDLVGRVRSLKDEIKQLKGIVWKLERELYRELGKNSRPDPSPLTLDFVKKHIRFLIFACHPDRNGGRAESTEVTRELLKLR